MRLWHRVYAPSALWRCDVDGVHVEGVGGPLRTPGEPRTCRRIWLAHRSAIVAASDAHGVPAALILATIATETGGRADAVREEPGYESDETTPRRVSAGLMQTLLSTASEMLGRQVTRAELLEPWRSIDAGTRYLAAQASVTGYDAVLALAAYNAGGIYHDGATANRWRLRCYPLGTGEHIDRGAKWYGDACAVVGSS